MKKLLFDFDGTLVDSMGVYTAAMLRVLDNQKIAYSQELMKVITPLGHAGTADYYISHLGINLSREEILQQMRTYCLTGYRDYITEKETVADTLQILKARGYSLNILTASPHSMLDVCLKRLRLWELFDNVWSCEDFSMTKSHPEIYRRVAQCLGTVASDCVLFDDNIHADKTAKAAGMQVVGVYDASSEADREEMTAICDGYIFRFDEIPALLTCI